MKAPKLFACLNAIALFVLALSWAMSTPANAAALEKLSDGRAVVTVFGERLTFRQKDAEHIEFVMGRNVCHPKLAFVYTLKQWLEDPEVAKCMDRAIPDSSGDRQAMQIWIGPIIDNGFLFPGAINQDRLAPSRNQHLTVDLNYPAQNNCQSRPLCILCAQLGSYCGVLLSSRDQHAMLYFTWQVSNIYAPNTANWPRYDVVARDIARSIFIDRPAGDFQ